MSGARLERHLAWQERADILKNHLLFVHGRSTGRLWSRYKLRAIHRRVPHV